MGTEVVVAVHPAELLGVGVVVVEADNGLGVQIVLNGDEDEANENE